jgi:hypothetical protein
MMGWQGGSRTAIAHGARAEVISRMRHAMRDKASLAPALPGLKRAIGKHFKPRGACF